MHNKIQQDKAKTAASACVVALAQSGVKSQYDKMRQQRDRLQMWVKRQHDKVRQQRVRLQMWDKRQHDKV